MPPSSLLTTIVGIVASCLFESFARFPLRMFTMTKRIKAIKIAELVCYIDGENGYSSEGWPSEAKNTTATLTIILGCLAF